MNPKSVNHTRTPGYPTRREVLAGAASFVLCGMSGRGLVFAEASGSGATESGGPIVAPIFEHGEGRGTIGCSMVTPPVFLSEEEGMQILDEELAKHGVKLKPGGLLEGVRIPARTEFYETVVHDDGQLDLVRKVKESPEDAKPLKLDGLDPEKNIAVQLITLDDYFDLGGPRSGSPTTNLDFKETAEKVAEAAKKQGRRGVFLGVFYQPMRMKPPADLEAKAEAGDPEPLRQWKERHPENQNESRNMLRQQAKDFAAWLKEQEAIPGGGSESSSGSESLLP